MNLIIQEPLLSDTHIWVSFPSCGFISLTLLSATSLQGLPGSVVQIAPYQVCKDTAHFDAVFQDILDGGGEGVILRDPASPAMSGRCPGFLKHKVFPDSFGGLCNTFDRNTGMLKLRLLGLWESINGNANCEYRHSCHANLSQGQTRCGSLQLQGVPNSPGAGTRNPEILSPSSIMGSSSSPENRSYPL